MTNSSQLMWNKLRNVIVGAALFKKAGKKSARRRQGSNSETLLTTDDLKTQNMEHAISRSSLDSVHSQDTEAAHSDCKLFLSIRHFILIHSQLLTFVNFTFSFERQFDTGSSNVRA